MSQDSTRSRGSSALLALAAVAVAFAAADTYVVVLSLPDMMGSVGLSIDELQRAAPIISGFLLGYVAMLPLIGRIADLRGRLPVLVASLLVFGFGSLVTAAAYDLPSLVTGRFLQGVGGGGLVPVTLALVADIYPVERRGVPLGIVGAVQELGSVLGPLYGAAVLAFGDWRDIFWINLAAGLVLAAGVAALGRGVEPRPRRRFDVVGLTLLALWIAALLVVMRQPERLVTSVRWGGPFVPFGDDGEFFGSIWFSQAGLVTIGLGLGLLAWLLIAPARAFVDLRDWWASVRQADLLGALLLAVLLGGVILAFATADPEVQVFSDAGPVYLGTAALAAVAFAVHQRRAASPLIPRGAFGARPAWGSLLVSFFVGAALIAALVDIPIFARVTVYGDSQIKAALVLVELLVALPIGALIGGYLTRAYPSGLIAAAGMALSSFGFWMMSTWDVDALHHLSSSAVLALTGLGFGLALAPVNAALLATTEPAVHGVTSAMLVVSRMVGMLVGISALTTIGLRRYYAVSGDFPAPSEVCGGPTRCDRYSDLLQHAGIEQLHAIFIGASLAALLAALLAVVLFRGAATRGAPTSPLLGIGG
ncbi:MFS transporter [Nocardioides marmoriginsengisoli]|uniref:MFS transporter n=1 Tax=Nocardioides marmoriginsengisoli TaxID=661483 RepID=A0A3N0CPR1_9ACTN|nr:MFS transporter [Nocardioides marmoriginsengisoli]RNL64883.1 MFS transporter [Nocardioides marmoriginsengisoli]